MKRLAWLIVLVLGCQVLGLAQSASDLIAGVGNSAQVVVQSLGYDRKNFSPLSEINKRNVRRLVTLWTTSLMNDAGELAAPTIYNGVMYVVNGRWTFALDVATGRQVWRTPTTINPDALKVAPFGPITRGAATI